MSHFSDSLDSPLPTWAALSEVEEGEGAEGIF